MSHSAMLWPTPASRGASDSWRNSTRYSTANEPTQAAQPPDEPGWDLASRKAGPKKTQTPEQGKASLSRISQAEALWQLAQYQCGQGEYAELSREPETRAEPVRQ